MDSPAGTMTESTAVANVLYSTALAKIKYGSFAQDPQTDFDFTNMFNSDEKWYFGTRGIAFYPLVFMKCSTVYSTTLI